MRDRGERQGDDSYPVVSIWIAYVTEGRARVDGKEEDERERLCSIASSSPPALVSLIGSLRNDDGDSNENGKKAIGLR